MEERFNREDELMKRLLQEAGAETPSIDFKRKLMLKVEARNIELSPYKPLISKNGWIGISAMFLVAMAGLFFLHADMTFISQLNFEFPHLFDLPEINLSRTMQYAIGFVALFFLQVPLLKRFLDREYQL